MTIYSVTPSVHHRYKKFASFIKIQEKGVQPLEMSRVRNLYTHCTTIPIWSYKLKRMVRLLPTRFFIPLILLFYFQLDAFLITILLKAVIAA